MNNKIRVAIYARVSTKHEAQLHAFENQVEWYERFFERKPEWEMVKMYTDEGITGTSVKKREGFKAMIADAYEGKFDIIATREVSRFSRNIVDCLTYLRQLRKIGIYVHFLNDYISTEDADYEEQLTHISLQAQNESTRTSKRAKSGHEICMRKGVLFGNGNILGYDRDNSEKELRLNPEQAQTVKMIFDWYLGGWGLEKIKYELEKAGRLTAMGKAKWHASVISKTLKNPFYCGTIVYRKQYVDDIMEHTRVINYKKENQIIVEGTHETIVSKEDFEKVQSMLEARRQAMPYVETGKLPKGTRPPTSVWCPLLECICGHNFNRRKWNRNATGTQYGYQCYNSIHTGTVQTRKNKGLSLEGVCDTPMVQEWKLELMSRHIFSKAPLEADNIVELAFSMIESHIEDKKTEINNGPVIAQKQAQIDRLMKGLNNLVDMRAMGEIDKDTYIQKKIEFQQQIDTLQTEISLMSPTIVEEQKTNLRDRLDELKQALERYADFSEDKDIPDHIIQAFVEKIVVSKDGFDWYMRYSPENAISCDVEGRKGKANVTFAPKTPFTSSQHRLLSKNLSN